jgi:NADH-quinone oxidoreductase subunit N
MITAPVIADFAPLGADIILLVGALSIILADLILPEKDRVVLAWGSLLVVLASFISTFTLDLSGVAWGGVYATDSATILIKQIVLFCGAIALLASIHPVQKQFPRRQTEYHTLLIFSVLGASLLAGAKDIVFLAVAFELMGIPLYVLSAYDRHKPTAVEGALKLVLSGTISAAVLGFGLSILVGMAGSTTIEVIAAYVTAHPSPIVLLGGSLAFAGVGFKLGVFPFHQWVPDTYQGATIPIVAFLSVAPKVGGIAALSRVLLPHNHALLSGVQPVIFGIAGATIIIGNMLALNQTSVRRLLAYSGVGHMGFALLALGTGTVEGISSLLFYLAAYAVTNLGAFLVVGAVEQGKGDAMLSDFQGLDRRNSALAAAMLVFLLSLAGIPFVIGFWGKLAVFIAAWGAGQIGLVILGALMSVVGLFYYMRIGRSIYMSEPLETTPIDVPTTVWVAIGITLLLVVVLGLYPAPLYSLAQEGAVALLAFTAI